MKFDEKGSNFYKLFIDKYNPDSLIAQKRFKELYPQIRKLLKKSQKGIELGTGCGLFPIFLEKKGYRVDGIDFNDEYLLIAKKIKKRENSDCRFFKGDLTRIRLKNKYDYALILGNTIPHFDIKKLDRIIKNSKKYLKKKSKVIFDYNDWISLFLNKYPFHFIEKEHPKIISEHKKFNGKEGAVYREFTRGKRKFTLKLNVWSPFILDYLMEQNGFSLVEHKNIKNNKYISVYKLK